MSDLHEAAQCVRPPSATGYATMTVNGIRIAAAVAGGRVYWESKDGGPVHLHVDASPTLKALILRIRSQINSNSEELQEFDALCQEFGVEPWRW